jgi:hypothetical protein
MTSKNYLRFLISFFPLFLGGLIYLLFRDNNILFYFWLEKININYSFYKSIIVPQNIIQSYIIFSLPNGLWLLSGILFLNIIWKNKMNNFYIYTSVLVFFALFFEIAQLLDIINGTFDIIDIMTIISFSIIGIIISIFWRKYEKYK